MRSLLRKAVNILIILSVNSTIAMVSILAIVGGPKISRLQRKLLNMVGVKTKGKVFVGRGAIIYSPDRLVLGDRVLIGDNAHIACHAPIIIGDDFLAGPGLYLNSGGHDTRTLESFSKPIRIGDRVWCGVRVTICAGVEIGDDVVIGAGSVVVKSIPARSVAVGVPAKKISEIGRNIDGISKGPLG